MEEEAPEASMEEFREAGKIGAKVREESKKLINIGEGILDIAETIEGMIREEGAEPAFPANVSVNEIAAHYTPEFEDGAVIGENDVVKVDMGAELNGALSDTAYTIDLSGKHGKLVEASEKALESAISNMRAGVSIGEIGGIIEEKIKEYGFKPVANLTGHRIKTGMLHSGIDVPSIKTDDPYQLQEGEVYAIEPFATDGKGFVSDTDQVEIFSLYMPGRLRMRQSRKLLNHIISNYGMLPFAERWLMGEFKSKLLLKNALKEMLRMQVIKGYPVLKEAGGGLVSQAEHTLLIKEDGAEVLTK
ncbi:type II methionyl aminopeptidase [Candidatus Micrarchaeota archaeon]|nr:type II methionyl aminopeptidase [Candidatus Micrarchaeota archaeon]MBD3417709.1 type II methionyl aminopeptidase [Candidatus Micrarchaeota archaeon]